MADATTSEALVKNKSLQAVVSAIEVYNKPSFRYREESFAILICNAWELLFKAKALKDNSEDLSVITVTHKKKDETGAEQTEVKTNRSGNAMTVGVLALGETMLAAKVAGMTRECVDNVSLLIEVRDNAIHLVNQDAALAKTILELGTASLKNYMSLATKWFGVDFSQYNFFLMPISFYHGHEAAEAVSVSLRTEQEKRLLKYIAATAEKASSEGEDQVSLAIETRIVRGRGADGIPIRWTSDPGAPAMKISEENLLERYPYDADQLTSMCRKRYAEFKQNNRVRQGQETS